MLTLIFLSGVWHASVAAACPFCTAVGPTFSQERDSAEVAALAEVDAAEESATRFRLHQVAKGQDLLGSSDFVSADVGWKPKPGQLVMLLGTKVADAEKLRWSAIGANEVSAAYFLGAPGLRASEAARLKYFAPFLEHPDAAIAEDAYREFGKANFYSVAEVANLIAPKNVREWLVSPRIPQERKGLYGLLLGLASNDADRKANAQLLRERIVAEKDDFRAGFDGVLGGYLLLEGEAGLKTIESQILANPKAAVGDLRHAMTALRFYHEYGDRIPHARLAKSMALLLARPDVADFAITDLARWQAWEYCNEIAALYGKQAYATPAMRQAIVGYLRACPKRTAARKLEDLRSKDPAGVATAEEVLSKLGRLPQ